VGRFFPWAQTLELELIADFTSWLFWHDDVCDESTLGEDAEALAQRFDALLGILTRRTRPRPEDAFDTSLEDLRDRFERAAPSWGWYVRVVRSIQEYFEGCVWESVNRGRRAVPGVGVFVPMRRFAGGMHIYCDFVELANRAELPLVARGHREVARLRELTMNVACWHNDLFSVQKELAYGDVHNLVLVLAKERSLDIEEATAVAIAHANSEVALFAPTRARIPGFGVETDLVLEAYQKGLGALMRGNLDWSIETGRYRRAVSAPPKAPPSLVPRSLAG
jgi:5-epi-alpha-selinene synthase